MNNVFEFTSHPDLAAKIRAAAIAERDLRNEVANCADRADALADVASDDATKERCRKLAGELRCEAAA